MTQFADDDHVAPDPLSGTDDWKFQTCVCSHSRGVHGGHDGLARCALRSCYCAAFQRLAPGQKVRRMSDWDDRSGR